VLRLAGWQPAAWPAKQEQQGRRWAAECKVGRRGRRGRRGRWRWQWLRQWEQVGGAAYHRGRGRRACRGSARHRRGRSSWGRAAGGRGGGMCLGATTGGRGLAGGLVGRIQRQQGQPRKPLHGKAQQQLKWS
jgi:hypothetical protein